MLRLAFISLILACLAPLATSLHAQIPTHAQPELDTLTLRVGKATITAELALTSEQKATGLMFRQKMADDHGMLFFFVPPRQVSFWMMNTLLPLTCAYVDASGKILELHDMQPQDTTSIVSKSEAVSFVLEMNQGWFDLNKIKEGDTLVPLKTTWPELLKAAAKAP